MCQQECFGWKHVIKSAFLSKQRKFLSYHKLLNSSVCTENSAGGRWGRGGSAEVNTDPAVQRKLLDLVCYIKSPVEKLSAVFYVDFESFIVDIGNRNQLVCNWSQSVTVLWPLIHCLWAQPLMCSPEVRTVALVWLVWITGFIDLKSQKRGIPNQNTVTNLSKTWDQTDRKMERLKLRKKSDKRKQINEAAGFRGKTRKRRGTLSLTQMFFSSPPCLFILLPPPALLLVQHLGKVFWKPEV